MYLACKKLVKGKEFCNSCKTFVYQNAVFVNLYSL